MLLVISSNEEACSVAPWARHLTAAGHLRRRIRRLIRPKRQPFDDAIDRVGNGIGHQDPDQQDRPYAHAGHDAYQPLHGPHRGKGLGLVNLCEQSPRGVAHPRSAM